MVKDRTCVLGFIANKRTPMGPPSHGVKGSGRFRVWHVLPPRPCRPQEIRTLSRECASLDPGLPPCSHVSFKSSSSSAHSPFSACIAHPRSLHFHFFVRTSSFLSFEHLNASSYTRLPAIRVTSIRYFSSATVIYPGHCWQGVSYIPLAQAFLDML
jgi:hypothetical protein